MLDTAAGVLAMSLIAPGIAPQDAQQVCQLAEVPQRILRCGLIDSSDKIQIK